MSDIVHEVWRGQQTLSMDLGGLVTSSTEIGPDQFMHLVPLHSKYSESDCVNSFHVEKPIRLKGVGFFGPTLPCKKVGQKEPIEIKIDLRLEMQWKTIENKVKSRTLAEISKKINVDDLTQNNNITIIPVDFDSGIMLDPNAFKYNLIFRMETQFPTYELDPAKLETHVFSNGINWFFWPGSKQMPVLRFYNDES